jgi:hypothetical protein
MVKRLIHYRALTQAKERHHGDNHHNQTNDIDDAVHKLPLFLS